MTRIKTLSAVMILSAAIATPAFAQDTDATQPAPAHHVRVQDRSTYRGAFNQSNAAVNTAPRRDPFGFDGTEQYPRLLYSGN